MQEKPWDADEMIERVLRGAAQDSAATFRVKVVLEASRDWWKYTSNSMHGIGRVKEYLCGHDANWLLNGDLGGASRVLATAEALHLVAFLAAEHISLYCDPERLAERCSDCDNRDTCPNVVTLGDT